MDDYTAARMLGQSTVQVRMRYTPLNAHAERAAADDLAYALFKVPQEEEGKTSEAAGA